MAGASKKRANKERELARESDRSSKQASSHRSQANGSSSGDTSSSGKALSSARSRTDEKSVRSHRSTASRRTGYDGNRDPADERDPARSRLMIGEGGGKNLEIGAVGFAVMHGYDIKPTPPRPSGPSKLGQPTKIGLNNFEVAPISSKNKVYQFEVLVGKGDEKRGLIKKVWSSRPVQQELNKFGQGWIFDGNRLAWSLQPIDREIKVMVDLDKEDGRTARPGKDNNHRIVIRQTNKVRLETLEAYLEGKCTFDNSCLEAINYLDHVLREWPSTRYTQIKRSFFARGQQRFTLGNAVEAFKGVYQAMRISHAGPKARLTVVADVANGTFWTESMLHVTAVQLTNAKDPGDLVSRLRGGETSPTAKILKKLRKLHVTAQHRGSGKGQDTYVVEKLIYTGARDYKFEKDGKKISVYDYFMKEHNTRLQFPDLPLVKPTKPKNAALPMEVLKIDQNQRYPFKLDEKQTSNMIKFAVTAPPERWQGIQHGLDMVNWPNDPVLRAHNIGISTSKQIVDARVLLAPKVQFGTGDAKPGTSGRWDLKGKKFLTPNEAPLKSWAVCVIAGRRGGKPDKAAVQSFLTAFCNIYAGHGGRIENKQPAIVLAAGDDVGQWVTSAWNAAGNQSNSRPQILVFILPDRDSTTYGRIKRSGECRYGVVSQCMQYAQVQKAQPQYISNVCMKFNAKLGGQTGRAIGPKSAGPTGLFNVPTVIIGADVSHAAPGALTPSMAALTMSMDKLGIRYAANCETNGFRVEMISTDNITRLMQPMLQSWVHKVGGGKFPSRIIYFRDGVSDRQYQHVLEQEVADMKALIKTANPQLNIPFVVIVGSKRHHVRFFPEKGDKNGNPFPGTLVETGVTHPFENDFYLNSHAAIKGTARPMHYQVIMNEASMSNDEIYTMIYEHCYQYIRATTPISQHPAIYYAHIASNRAIPHDPKWSGSSDGTPQAPAPRERSGSQSGERPRSGSQSGSQTGKSRGTGGKTGSSSGAPTEFERLMPMPNQGSIQTSMWYI